MKGLLVVWTALLTYVHSICSGALYWDPFNNACVNGKDDLKQNAHGNLQYCTTLTPRQTNAWKRVRRLQVTTPTISRKVAWEVRISLSSLSIQCDCQDLLRQLLPQMRPP